MGYGRSRLRTAALALATVVLVACVALGWLIWESARPLDRHWQARRGSPVETRLSREPFADGLSVDRVALRSDSGLEVSFKVLRQSTAPGRLPVLVILVGQGTGAEAIHQFEASATRAVVAIDYPYAGRRDFRGLAGFFRNVPAMRRACRDTPAAVLLAIDWLAAEDWVDPERIVLAGVSLGVPFVAAAAASDARLSGLILAHGAADNRAWAIATAARYLPTLLAVPAGTLVNWLGYGPAYDTAAHVRRFAPRPILIVGARDDERTPAGQAEVLYEAAAPNRRLRWTEGQHVQMSRREIVLQLMGILDRELLYLTGDARAGG